MSTESLEHESKMSTLGSVLPTPFHTSKPVWNPHEYQKRAITMLLQQACAGLFLDPGLGKTATAISAFKLLKKSGYVKRMLVIAPLRPCYSVWPAEIRKWANFQDLTYAILHGPDKNELLDADADIFIVNVDGVRWLFDADRYKRIRCEILCVDESSKFRSPGAKTRFKVLRDFVGKFKRRWILTGTPAPNGLIGLWSQIYLLDQGATLFPYVTRFRTTYFTPSGYGGYEWRPYPWAQEVITEKIAPLVVRMRAEDYLSMPDIQYIKILVDLPPNARRAYTEMENQFYLEVDSGEVVAANAAVAGTKCRQIANGAVYNTELKVQEVHDAKLDAFEDLVEELSGQPVLVLYEYRHDFDRMVRRTPGAHLGSGVSPKKSESIINSFNAGEIQVLYGHPASMGHGLNLQEAAHHIIFFGLTWDLELYDQVIRRVYRQGQKAEKVLVYHILARDTLDETVYETLQVKDRTQKNLLEAFTNRPARGTIEAGRN
jgi:SNF2 family DNA or RNA helicase